MHFFFYLFDSSLLAQFQSTRHYNSNFAIEVSLAKTPTWVSPSYIDGFSVPCKKEGDST